MESGVHSFVDVTRSVHAPIALVGTPLDRLRTRRKLPRRNGGAITITVGGIRGLVKVVARLLRLRGARLRTRRYLGISPCSVGTCLRRGVTRFRLTTVRGDIKVRLRIRPSVPGI